MDSAQPKMAAREGLVVELGVGDARGPEHSALCVEVVGR